MWRPEEGWDNPYKQETPEHWSDNYAVIQSKEWHIFEAGADVMLGKVPDILEKLGYPRVADIFRIYCGLIPGEPQHIVVPQDNNAC